jgi:hypothetical protein
VAAILVEGQELDPNILSSPVRRTRIFTEGVAVRRIGELCEQASDEGIASITMPHKRDPEMAEL